MIQNSPAPVAPNSQSTPSLSTAVAPSARDIANSNKFATKNQIVELAQKLVQEHPDKFLVCVDANETYSSRIVLVTELASAEGGKSRLHLSYSKLKEDSSSQLELLILQAPPGSSNPLQIHFGLECVYRLDLKAGAKVTEEFERFHTLAQKFSVEKLMMQVIGDQYGSKTGVGIYELNSQWAESRLKDDQVRQGLLEAKGLSLPPRHSHFHSTLAQLLKEQGEGRVAKLLSLHTTEKVD